MHKNTLPQFRRTVWAYYKKHGRHTLPWRQTNDPYQIMVSELMLQQTQVERVIPKYLAFIQKYPTPQALAAAPLRDVLALWVGLGYNRRAKYLKAAAEAVVALGAFPKTEVGLRALPGVGPYTAAAIRAFAYNEPVVMIETNIRTVFLHHFFAESNDKVSDAAILSLVAAALPKAKSKEWYAALMDYGTYLKKTHGNNTKRSKSYTKQSRFAGSDRQIRGAIVRTLTLVHKPMTLKALQKIHPTLDAKRLTAQLQALLAEGMIEQQKGKYLLAT